MARIAGISAIHADATVRKMLEIMQHHRNSRTLILDKGTTTYGISWTDTEDLKVHSFLADDKVCDFKGPHHLAWAKNLDGSFFFLKW